MLLYWCDIWSILLGISTEASFGSPGGVSGDLVVVRIFCSFSCRVNSQKLSALHVQMHVKSQIWWVKAHRDCGCCEPWPGTRTYHYTHWDIRYVGGYREWMRLKIKGDSFAWQWCMPEWFKAMNVLYLGIWDNYWKTLVVFRGWTSLVFTVGFALVKCHQRHWQWTFIAYCRSSVLQVFDECNGWSKSFMWIALVTDCFTSGVQGLIISWIEWVKAFTLLDLPGLLWIPVYWRLSYWIAM